MHITWHGLSCVKLQTNTGSLLFNPFQDTAAVSMPKLKVDIAAMANEEDDNSNNIGRLQGDPFVIGSPGEYEIGGVFIYGVPLTGQTGFVVSCEGLTIGHPGVTVTDYTAQQLERFDGVDVLFLPLSGSTSKQQSAFLSQVEPRVIIPIHYKTAKMKKAPSDWATLDAFAKEMGTKDVTPEQKVIIKNGKLPQDETQVTILDIS